MQHSPAVDAMQPLVTAITALRFVQLKDSAKLQPHNTLFAGIGNQLHILQPGDEQSQAIWKVFPDGERVHGFSGPVDNCVIVTGGRYLSVIHAKVENGEVSGGPIVDSALEFDDWVWESRWIAEGRFFLVICGHSKVLLYDTCSLSRKLVIQSPEKELTWSTTLFLTENKNRLRAAAGTSFGDILVWSILDATTEGHINELVRGSSKNSTASTKEILVVHRLHGHDGPIMKIKVSREARRMVSASVDRTIRVWETCKESSCYACQPDACFIKKFVHYGHLARVWDVSFLQEGRADVVSVAEDRTCRVWSGDVTCQQTAVYRGHAGRNVWSLAVQSRDDRTGWIATGGEDGCIKIRTIPLSLTRPNSDFDDTGNNQTETCGSRKCASANYEIPDVYANPRKNGGAYNESGRTLVFSSDKVLIMSTDFGRILQVNLDSSQTQTEEPDDERISWTELYRDKKGIAFTPSSLAHCNGLLFAGQTNGNITVLKHTPTTGECSNAVKVGDIAVFLERTEMVMGLFAASSQDETMCHLLAATISGELFHWTVTLEKNNGVSSRYRNTYRQRNPTKSAVVTSVIYVAELDSVIVGDRGGRVLVYDGSQSEVLHENEDKINERCFIVTPSSTCRPHQDRVSTILHCSLNAAEDEIERSTFVKTYEMVTGSFDGSMARIMLSVCTHETDGVDRELSLKVISKQKSVERVDTIGRLIFPRMNGSNSGCEQVFSRQCVVGFRSAHVVVWDVQQRNEIFRKNCGNWRRAYDIHLEVRCDGDSKEKGRLSVEKMRLAFWRSGRLHVVQTLERNEAGERTRAIGKTQDDRDGDETFVQTIGAGFHGQRANTVTWFEGSEIFVTGSEDTTLHVTRLKEGRWETIQRLSRHISGVNCVSWARLKDGKIMLFSGGGSDELVGWISDKPMGPWRDVCRIVTDGKDESRAGALQRVMCVVGVGGELCECEGGCGMAVVGRSDGSVGLVRMKKGKGFRLVGEEWDGELMQIIKGHRGALLCCVGEMITVERRKGFLVMTGDSTGDMGMWWIDGGGKCEQRRIVKLSEKEGVHDGGVNAIDIEVVEKGKLMVVSGGDDERVRMGMIELKWEMGIRAWMGEWKWASEVGLHSAAVTGLCTRKTVEGEISVVSVGADQRLNWINVREGDNGRQVCVRASGRSNVSDVAAVCGCVAERGGHVRWCAVVSGCGMEAIWRER